MRKCKSSNKKIIAIIVFTIILAVITSVVLFIAKNIKTIEFNFFGLNNNYIEIVNAAFRPTNNINPTNEQLESAKTIIETRLDSKNIFDSKVKLDSENNCIIVEFPWTSNKTESDLREFIQELGTTFELSFWLIEQQIDNDGFTDFVKAEEHPIITGENVVSADAVDFEGGYIISLKFDQEGTKLFADATKAHTGEIIGIYMDDLLLTYPTVQQEITDGKAQITGNFTSSEAIELAEKIQAGALPFALEYTYEIILCK